MCRLVPRYIHRYHGEECYIQWRLSVTAQHEIEGVREKTRSGKQKTIKQCNARKIVTLERIHKLTERCTFSVCACGRGSLGDAYAIVRRGLVHCAAGLVAGAA